MLMASFRSLKPLHWREIKIPKRPAVFHYWAIGRVRPSSVLWSQAVKVLESASLNRPIKLVASTLKFPKVPSIMRKLWVALVKWVSVPEIKKVALRRTMAAVWALNLVSSVKWMKGILALTHKYSQSGKSLPDQRGTTRSKLRFSSSSLVATWQWVYSIRSWFSQTKNFPPRTVCQLQTFKSLDWNLHWRGMWTSNLLISKAIGTGRSTNPSLSQMAVIVESSWARLLSLQRLNA